MNIAKNGYRCPHKDRAVWSVHTVDQGFWNGRSLKTRGNAAVRPQVGACDSFNTLAYEDFLNGVGLYVQDDQPTYWKVCEPITGDTLGYAPAASAIGYRDAAAKRGAILEIYNV